MIWENKKYLKFFLTILTITSLIIIFSQNYAYDTQNKICNYDLELICENILDSIISNTKIFDYEKTNYETFDLNKNNYRVLDLGCLASDIKIKIDDENYKEISEIEIGDKILSYDLYNDVYEYTKVISKKTYLSKDIYSINDGILKVTDDHPILVKDENEKFVWCSINPFKSKEFYSYRNVEKLRIGQRLFLSTNELVEINKIEYLPYKQIAIGLEVENNNHNFIANDFVVSNAYYTFKGYVEGVQSLDIANYVLLSGDKIEAFGDLAYETVRDLLSIPSQYNFKITISYGDYYQPVPETDFDLSNFNYYAIEKQNILVLPKGKTDLSNLEFGYLYIEVFF